jgi:O-antigen/teichoic acid export membrane protein
VISDESAKVRLKSSRWIAGDTSTALASTAAVKLRGIVIVLLVGRIYGADILGLLSLLVAAQSLCYVLCSFGVHFSLVSNLPADPSDRRRYVWSAAVLPSLSAFIMSLAWLGLIRTNLFANVLVVDPTAGLVAALAIAASPWEYLYANFRRATGRFRAHLVIPATRSAIEVVGATAIILLNYPGEVLVRAVIAIPFCSGVASLVGLAIVATPSAPQWYIVKKQLRFTWALYLGQVGAEVTARSDRFILAAYLDARLLGIYAIAYALASAVYALGGPLSSLAYGRFRLVFDQGRIYTAARSLATGLSLAMAYALAVMSAIALTYEWILDYFRLPASEATMTLLVLAIAGIPLIFSQFANVALVWQRRTVPAGFAQLLAGAISLAALVLLTPPLGLPGAALATLISYSFLALATTSLALPRLLRSAASQ